MNYHGTSALVWQPDIRVSTFPSGLVLVQRSAIGRASDNHRDKVEVGDILPADNTPAFDGLYIFPGTQETRTASHTTYLVSAYGRNTNKPIETRLDKIILNRSLTWKGEPAQEIWTQTTITFKGVVKANELLDQFSPTISAAPKVEIFTSGSIVTPANWSSFHYWQTTSSDRTNFGEWDEYNIVYEPVGYFWFRQYL